MKQHTGNDTASALVQIAIQKPCGTDEAILIQYDPDSPDVRDIKIAKNKEGLTGKIHANFDGDHQRFSLEETRYGGDENG